MASNDFEDFVSERGLELTKNESSVLRQTMINKGKEWVRKQFVIFDNNIERIAKMIDQKYGRHQGIFELAINNMYDYYGAQTSWNLLNGCDVKKLNTDNEVSNVITNFIDCPRKNIVDD